MLFFVFTKGNRKKEGRREEREKAKQRLIKIYSSLQMAAIRAENVTRGRRRESFQETNERDCKVQEGSRERQSTTLYSESMLESGCSLTQ